MTTEYSSVERVFALLFLISNAEDDGVDRAEIYAQIPAYSEHAASSRMLERDLACLERLGFDVERTRHGRQGTTYRIGNVKQVFLLT